MQSFLITLKKGQGWDEERDGPLALLCCHGIVVLSLRWCMKETGNLTMNHIIPRHVDIPARVQERHLLFNSGAAMVVFHVGLNGQKLRSHGPHIISSSVIFPQSKI